MRVNRSSYYKHFNNNPSPRTLENQKIKSTILTIYFSSKKRLGVYKINSLLSREYGINISIGRTYRLFKSMNLPKMSTVKPFIKYSKSNLDNTNRNNILNRNFNVNEPNLVWVSDITYVKVNGTFFYVCVIIDLFSRKVIAYKCSSSMSANLVISCFKEAFIKRNKPKNLIFHSDQGSQYTSKQFRDILDEFNVCQSVSNPGCPYDNAVAESFFKFLKLEELNRKSFSNKQDLQLSLFEYIEGFYNSRRPHSFNGNLSPNQKDFLFFNTIF